MTTDLSTVPLNTRFLEILVHDLRTPLNVISMTIHVLKQLSTRGGLDLSEDLSLMGQNLQEVERMLASMVEYAHLPGDPSELRVSPFQPERLLRDVIDEQLELTPEASIVLENQGGPSEVQLDPALARLAARQAIGNALSAADGHPIRVVLSGAPEHCLIEVVVEDPPRDWIEPAVLRSECFHRLLGTSSERRGLDLATVAKVSELFGGSARLDVEKGKSSAVVLDWPVRLI